jgi:hypothetical protein
LSGYANWNLTMSKMIQHKNDKKYWKSRLLFSARMLTSTLLPMQFWRYL